MMESQAGNKAPEVASQAKLPPLPTSHDTQQEVANKKRKREQRGKEVAEDGRDVSSKETEPHRGVKVAKTTQSSSQTDMVPGDRGRDLCPRNPALVLDGSPFLANSSIRDSQQGKAGYIADAVEQALLLPNDMTELRTLRTYEVFMDLKRELAKAVQAAFRAEELVDYSHR